MRILEEHEVKINKNPYGDTRTSPMDFSFEKFREANNEHADAVTQLMCNFGYAVLRRSHDHDFTKFTREEEFYRDFVEAMTNSSFIFTEGPWYRNHVCAERHHLNANVPMDVDLIDVIEMICDCVAAGLARSGCVRPVEISDDVLSNAVSNTVRKITEMCEIEES